MSQESFLQLWEEENREGELPALCCALCWKDDRPEISTKLKKDENYLYGCAIGRTFDDIKVFFKVSLQ